MAIYNPPIELVHKTIGRCQLLRTEGADWIVRQIDTGVEFRIPSSRRGEFRRVSGDGHIVPDGETTSAMSETPRGTGTSPASRQPYPSEPPESADVMAPVAATPQDIKKTSPELWAALRNWVAGQERLGQRNVVFCRMIYEARLSGRRLSDDELCDAWLLLEYARRQGFKVDPCQAPSEESADEKGGRTVVAFDAKAVSRVSGTTWAAAAHWTGEFDLFAPEVRQFCAALAKRKLQSEPIREQDFEIAATILSKVVALGFGSDRIEYEVDTRSEVEICDLSSTSDMSPEAPKVSTMVATSPPESVVNLHADLRSLDPRRLKRVIESLRIGLPPQGVTERALAVGLDQLSRLAGRFLSQTAQNGAATVIRGAYGNGKTFTLGLVEELALEQGFAVARAEVDAAENRLDKPHQLYRALLSSLRLPRAEGRGGRVLVNKAFEFLSHEFLSQIPQTERNASRRAVLRRSWLAKQLECEPLAWLFSDPQLTDKPDLVALLCGENHMTTRRARRQHILPGNERDWPRFFAGTQGDVASYLFAGLGHLCRLLGFRGLILILDEMEKWQDLDWKSQSRAGNLLGGLVWGATAPTGRRDCRQRPYRHYWQGGLWESCDHPMCLQHSGVAGGYPFTTASACHLGLTIAMTPRGGGPEQEWKQYGELDVVDLPPFGPREFKDCFEKIRLLYVRAYGLRPCLSGDVCGTADRQWRNQDDHSARSAVTAIIGSLDRWRDSQRDRVASEG